MIYIAKTDWNNYETSWDFTGNPLIRQQQNTLSIVPTLQRGNAYSDAPASRNAGALQTEFPRRSVGTIEDVDARTKADVDASQVGWATLSCPPGMSQCH